MKKCKIILIILMIGVLLSSCSRAYQPTNIQKKKGGCSTCSRF